MSQIIVGRWGRSLGIRVPADVARQCGLQEGEPVEFDLLGDDLVIRRNVARERARRDAEDAAAEIAAESTRHSLRGIAIRELLDGGRRG